MTSVLFSTFHGDYGRYPFLLPEDDSPTCFSAQLEWTVLGRASVEGDVGLPATSRWFFHRLLKGVFMQNCYCEHIEFPSFSFICESKSCSVVSDSLRLHGLYSPWNSPDQNTGVGCLSLLQGIFPTQGSNPGLPHCRLIIYQLSHKGNPGSFICRQVLFPWYFFKNVFFLFGCSRSLSKHKVVCSMWVLLDVACRIFACGTQTLSWGIWDLIPWPGIKPWPPALGAWSLSHWITEEFLQDALLLASSFTLMISFGPNQNHHLSYIRWGSLFPLNEWDSWSSESSHRQQWKSRTNPRFPDS